MPTLRFGHAHTGETHGCVLDDALLEQGDAKRLRQQVADACGIPEAEVIVLAGPPWRPLDSSAAALAACDGDDLRCFAYDRGLIAAPRADDAPRAQPPERRLQDACQPCAPPETLDDAIRRGLLDEGAMLTGGGPLQRALGEFTTQFRLRLAQGRAYVRCATDRSLACDAVAARQAVRSVAVRAALSNLRDHGDALAAAHEGLAARAARHGDVQRDALERFEDDLGALQRTQLHPALAQALDQASSRAGDSLVSPGPGSKSLADCVSADRVRRWAEHCARSLAAFESNGDRVAAMVDDIRERVLAAHAAQSSGNELDNSPHAESETPAVEAALQADAAAVRALCEAQMLSLEDLNADEGDATRAVADHIGPQEGSDLSASSTSALDVCRELQQRWDARAPLLPLVRARDVAMADAARRCGAATDGAAIRAVAALRAVADVQSRIHHCKSRHLAAQLDSLREKAAAFAQLEAVRRLPRAHAALCLEVARRRAYARLARRRVDAAAEDVAALRATELARRSEFATSHGARLPRSLLRAVPALLEYPRVFSPTFEPDATDPPLPRIDLQDLERDGTPLPAQPADASAVTPKRPRAWSCDSAFGGQEPAAAYDHGGGSIIFAAPGDGGDDDDAARGEEEDDDDDDSLAKLRDRCVALEFELAAARCAALNAPPPEPPEANVADAPADAAADAAADAPADANDGAPAVADDAPTDASAASAPTSVDDSAASADAASETASAAAAERRATDEGRRTVELEALRAAFAALEARLGELSEGPAISPPAPGAGDDDVVRGIEAQRDALLGKLAERPPAPPDDAVVKAADALEGVFQTDDFDEVGALVAVASTVSAAVASVASAAAAERLAHPKISFRAIQVGDVALFLPTSVAFGSSSDDGARPYLAFHQGCPHRYLAEACVQQIRAAHGVYPDMILGRVTRLDRHVVESTDAASNPFRLAADTAYWVVTVEAL
ncbi:hypothetical protein M885DRAFT_532428 [Pelagophyceae sp. CCMP2097]|nr:hypothetical protein M885DRAFT_532428 [Pelagophyceae sp. CCMP2097]|mmetsp:Transcript_25454/g.87335  ORF Transcript_25454/g.87335 Transcript_25454/m.87335 type:complete len:965 (+) Transcript_25454:205-3099(+)